jgi:hypothetical protein
MADNSNLNDNGKKLEIKPFIPQPQDSLDLKIDPISPEQKPLLGLSKEEEAALTKSLNEQAEKYQKEEKQRLLQKELEKQFRKSNPYDYKEYQAEIPPINTSYLKEYGNNYFELITGDINLTDDEGKGGFYRLAGVLKEVPSFSMSCTWEKGPASTISDTVKGFMCSSLMEIVTTLGGNDRSWMNLDEGTDRVYASTDRPSFSLNFKLYTNDNIGSQQLSTWKTWLRALSIYATPSVDAKVNINEMANNAIQGFVNSLGLINDITSGFKEGFDSDEKKDIESKKSGFEKAVKGLEEAANKATGRIASRDGPKRVENSANYKNFYGSKIWYLRILHGIFKKPLIVYISDWGVSFSKEMNFETKEPIWIEFKITCVMDQIASAPVWMNYLSKN